VRVRFHFLRKTFLVCKSYLQGIVPERLAVKQQGIAQVIGSDSSGIEPLWKVLVFIAMVVRGSLTSLTFGILQYTMKIARF
jgi:hypothetical protein